MKKSILAAVTVLSSLTAFAQKPSPQLLNPKNHTLVLVDHESQMAFAVGNMPVDQLRTNTAIVAGASKIFKVPTVITTVAEASFSGPVFPEVQELSQIKHKVFRQDHYEFLGRCQCLQRSGG